MIDFCRENVNDAMAVGVEVKKPYLIGLGQAGINMLDQLIMHGPEGLVTLAIDTDQATLEASVVSDKIWLGAKKTRGLGCLGDLTSGQEIWRRESAQVVKLLQGHRDVLILLGLGGGTGSAFAPEIVRAARALGVRTTVVGVTPFSFENRARHEISRQSLAELRQESDCVLILANDRAEAWPTARENVRRGFHAMNQIVVQVIETLQHLITAESGSSLTFADLRSLFGRLGAADEAENCWMGRSEVETSQGVMELIEAALQSPLLSEATNWERADTCLACLTGGSDLSLADLQAVMRILQDKLPGKMTIKLGTHLEASGQGRMQLTLFLAAARQKTAVVPISSPPEVTAPVLAPKLDLAAIKPVVIVKAKPLAIPSLAEQLASKKIPLMAIPKPGTTNIPVVVPVKPVESTPAAVSVKAVIPFKPARKVEPVIDLPEVVTQTPAEKIPVVAGEARPVPKKRSVKQEELPFDNATRGRFEKACETIYKGENLDQPTFRRRKILIKTN